MSTTLEPEQEDINDSYIGFDEEDNMKNESNNDTNPKELLKVHYLAFDNSEPDLTAIITLPKEEEADTSDLEQEKHPGINVQNAKELKKIKKTKKC
ncbi:hypothetical protein C0995_009735 [Termitomyces sp. Mi166|nr:hypothetical protein C0995_009735 [Termitomyces sp. Mi166\